MVPPPSPTPPLAAGGNVRQRVQVYLTEDDRTTGRAHTGGELVAHALLDRAAALGAGGVTVWRAVEGVGRSGRLRSIRTPDAELGLPLVVELVDDDAVVAAFLQAVAELAPGALVTVEDVTVGTVGGSGSR
jgi:PII-like signaling protein